MKRAQKPEQKDQRRNDILSKAREFHISRDYRAIKLQDIADSLDLAKGTLYRYFPTKQDLFMELYREDLTAWLSAWSDAGKGPVLGMETIAERWTETLVSNPALVRLIGSFHSEIEPDLSPEGLLSFKLFIRDFFTEAAGRLETLVPSVRGKGFDLILGAYILVQGCMPLCYPPSRIHDLLRDTPELSLFRLEFRTLFPPLLERLTAQKPGPPL